MSLPNDATPPAVPARIVTFDLSRLPSAGTALGTGLLSALVLVSAYYSRNTFDFRVEAAHQDDLHLAPYLLGLGAVVLLGGVALAGLALDRITDPTAVSWPGAAAALGAGIMLAVAVGDSEAAFYSGTLVALAFSAAGLLVTRAAPFVVGGLIPLAMLYAKVVGDAIDAADLGGTTTLVLGASALVVFVVLVTSAGWLLPDTRVLTGILAGVIAMFALVGAAQFMAFTGVVSSGFSASDSAMSGEDFDTGIQDCIADETIAPDEGPVCDDEFFDESYEESYEEYADYPDLGFSSEIAIILGFAAALALFWSGLSLATGHVGFRVLALTDLLVVVPTSMMALYLRHPAWPQAALLVLGGGILLVAALVQRRPAGATAPPVAP